MRNSDDFDLNNKLLLPIKSIGESENNSKKEDYKYDKPIEYWLLVIGYAIGYGSFWRFPYLIYTCGGGVFFIPFFIFFFFISIPLFTLETTYGQIFKKGPVEMFTYINKKFQGIGWASVIVSFFVSLYYAIILCWSVFYFFQSFISPLPWSKEAYFKVNNKIGNFTSNSNTSNEDYFNIDYFPKEVLGISEGLAHMGGLNSHLAICLIITYLLIYYCISEGIKSSSKVVYFTAPAPIILLLVLFIKALTLPGIGIGLKYLFYPNFWKLFDLDVWIKASNQVVYVLNIGMGGNMIFSSYRKEKEDIYFSSFWLPMLTIIFGILCAIINFSYLGNFSYVVNIPIEKLPLSGTDLAFTTYPSALGMLPFPNFWAIIFFFTLITLGIDSQFAFNENVSHYSYEFFLKKYLTKNQTTKLICIVGLVMGLPFVMEGGFYLFELVDEYSTNACFLISFFECYLLTNFIGEDTLKYLIKKKTGKDIPQYVYDSINKFAPYSLGGLFVLSFLGSIIPKHYILWAFIIQIILVSCPLIAIIGFYYLYKDEPEISIGERKRMIELQEIN